MGDFLVLLGLYSWRSLYLDSFAVSVVRCELYQCHDVLSFLPVFLRFITWAWKFIVSIDKFYFCNLCAVTVGFFEFSVVVCLIYAVEFHFLILWTSCGEELHDSMRLKPFSGLPCLPIVSNLEDLATSIYLRISFQCYSSQFTNSIFF